MRNFTPRHSYKNSVCTDCKFAPGMTPVCIPDALPILPKERHNGVDILSWSELACLLHANGVCLGRVTSVTFDYFHVLLVKLFELDCGAC